MSRLAYPFFGIGLNPGHLMHLDECVHSPIRKGSHPKLRYGMALQRDIIPGTGTGYFTSDIEDGIALADEALRDDLASRHPEAWSNMREVPGIALRPEVLPLSSMPAWLPPFWLVPGKAIVLR